MELNLGQPPMLMQLYSRLMHHLSISSGLTKLSFNPIVDQQFSNCNGLLTAKMLNGMSIKVEPNDYHGRVLYLFGTNDPKVHAVTQGLLFPGYRFLDIGANYSSIGLLATDRVGSSGQVHLFEPQPHICQYVEEAIKKTGLTNVHLHRVALMDREGEMQLAKPQDHSGMATLIDYCDQTTWDSISVPVKNIANHIPPLIDSAPFGVKIDVEGAEPYLMPWLLDQPNLQFMIFEAAHNHQQLWDLIEAKPDFKLYGLERVIFTQRIRHVPSFNEMSLYHDLVAVRFPDTLELPVSINPYALGRMLKKHRQFSEQSN
ncbi:FkbM family methyltransferase [Stanieria sp. NIES-3757]|nr:FkbM family methyltransferase [Stanieria sp. NIES-3757]